MIFCDECFTMKHPKTRSEIKTIDGKKYRFVDWECPACGASGTKKQRLRHTIVDEQQEAKKDRVSDFELNPEYLK